MRELTGTTTLFSGLSFPEAPRWRDGKLWFSDMHARQVLCARLDGRHEAVPSLEDDFPSGLGWLPDGRLLVVAMSTRQLRRVEADGSVVVHADLSGIATGDCNDMIVRSDGTAWLGDMGYDVFGGGIPSGPGQVIVVSPAGEARRAAGDLATPNGHVLSADERTLIVAESGGFRLLAFDVAQDGSLGRRRVFAELTPEPGTAYAPPDGICLDAEGAVWCADPIGRRVLRIVEGGEVTHIIRPAQGTVPVACVLGGSDRRTLLIAVSQALPHGTMPAGNGRIDAIEVDVPGAGAP